MAPGMGWFTSTNGVNQVPNFRGAMGANPGQVPIYNVTTIKYPLNTRTVDLAGIKTPSGPNKALSSMHQQGVTILLLDGSVHFVPDSIDLLTLRRLATRNDGVATSL